MVNPNKKVKRPNGLGNVYKYKQDEEGNIFTLPILSLIQENYIYLYRALKKENYFIAENDSCFFFKDIVYDNEVVGFATYKTTQIDDNSLVMQYFYVLPEYRDKGLLVEELDDSSTLFESNVMIEYPTRDMMDVLVKHRLARVFDDRFLISRIQFMAPMFSLDDALSGVVREEFDTTGYKCYNKMSLLYDLELCAVIGLAADNIENVYNEDSVDEENINDYNMISLPLRVDDEKYDCISKRRNDSSLDDASYFKNVKELVLENEDVIQNWLSLM